MSSKGDVSRLPSGRFKPPGIQEVIYGYEQIKLLPQIVNDLGARRVLLVTGNTLYHKTDLPRMVADYMGDHLVATFHQCKQHTPTSTLDEGRRLAEEHEVDLMLSLGGGSVIDTAKGIALALGSQGEIEPFKRKVDKKAKIQVESEDLTRSVPGHVAIPTTLSGAESTYQAGITDSDSGIKDQYYHPELLPSVVILDPVATVDTPEELWLSSGIKALDHAVETLYSIDFSPLKETMSQKAINLIYRFLERSGDTDDLLSRGHLQQASWLATFGYRNFKVGISHAIAHRLCGLTGIGHGMASCIILPAAMAYNAPASFDRFHLIASALEIDTNGQSDQEIADKAVNAVRSLIRRLGLGNKLSDFDVTSEHLDTIAPLVLTDTALRGNPRPVESAETVRNLLEKAF